MPEQRTLLLQRAFQASKVLPAEVHREAWRHAVEAGNLQLQLTLIKRDDAPGDLVETYSRFDDNARRGAFLSRTLPLANADPISKERRASVLLEVLQARRADPVVKQACVDAFVAKPTKKLLEEVATFGDDYLTADVADAALRVIDRTPPGQSLGWGAHWLVRLAAALGPDRATELIGKLGHPSLVATLARFDLGDDVVLDAVIRAVDGSLTRLTTGAVNDVEAQLLLGLLNGVATGRGGPRGAAASLVRERLHVPDGPPSLGKTIAQLVDEVWTLSLNQLKEPLAEWANRPGPSPVLPAAGGVDQRVADTDFSKLPAMASQPDTRLLSAVVTRFAGDQDLPIAFASITASLLLQNAHLAAKDRARLVAAVDRHPRAATGAAWGELARLPALVMFPDDEKLRTLWCRLFPEHVVKRHGWEPFGGAAAAANLFGDWVARDDDEAHDLVRTALHAGVPIEALGATPAGRLDWLFETPHSVAQVTSYLAKRLGDDSATWSAFWDLVPTYPGTLDDVTAACAAACTA